MELLTLILLTGMLGLALGTQISRQPPQVTVVQVQPEPVPQGGAGCASIVFAVLIFLVLSWLVGLAT